MKDKFPDIVDSDFTAQMEGMLDEVEAGTVQWKQVIADFYGGFAAELKKAEDEIAEVQVLFEKAKTALETGNYEEKIRELSLAIEKVKYHIAVEALLPILCSRCRLRVGLGVA